uniref:SUN domain-containing protein n=1 Tax=Caenorhabditis japonica TaxID=281687 RepID=A0A8R1HRU3_CAEJA
MAPSDANTSFETHQWKSEFASTRSGRNSPNIFAKVRRKLLLTPPVRNVRSPRFTDEELDALTGALPYETNYTYAYSKIYDPSLPDHWEVPNLGGGPSPRYLAEQEHWSAASLSRQLFYLLRFPVVLLIHVITYILEAIYQVVKISTFSVWEYFLYLIKTVKIRYEAYLDHRRRTALIRNRQDPLKVKASRFFYNFWETVVYVVLLPVRVLSRSNAGVEQYNYKSIKNQLETERASRMMTRSQTLEQSRRIQGLSQSPSRRAPIKQSTLTTITAKIFSSGDNGSTNVTPTTSTVRTTRTIKERSVTPRFRSTRQTRGNAHQAFRDESDAPEIGVDTPLSTYGLRGRALSHLNTPEPTFDIGNAAATSTPLFAGNFVDGETSELYENSAKGGNTLWTIFSWLAYFFLVPLFAARHVGYTFYDYGKSSIMKLTNYQPKAMEPVYVRDENEPVGVVAAPIIAAPLSTRIIENVKLVAFFIPTALYNGAFALGGFLSYWTEKAQEKVLSVMPQVSKRFSWCNLLGLLLVLLLAIFLVGFLTSENTDLRVKNLKQNVKNDSFVSAAWKHATGAVKFIWEFIVDIAFNIFNIWTLVASKIGEIVEKAIFFALRAFYAVRNFFFAELDRLWSAIKYMGIAIKGLAQRGQKNVDGYVKKSVGVTEKIIKDIEAESVKTHKWLDSTTVSTKNFFYNGYVAARDFLSTTFYSIFGFFYAIPSTVSSFFISMANYLNHAIYDHIWLPISGYIHNFNAKQLFQPIANGIDHLWKLIFVAYKSVAWTVGKVISTVLWYLSLPFGLLTRAFVHISRYAPDDVIQVLPIPQAVTPGPILDNLVNLEKLEKKVEVEDEKEEQLVIHPAPAPVPIPIPNEPPVVIHQTNVVETVDKEAIIKEVTEKLRAELSAELSAQFKQELSTKIEQNYNTIIEKLKVENTNVQIDNAHLEGLIRQMILEYDTDKTGQVDYALESAGGSVISTRCSETYRSYTRLEKFWNIPLYYHDYSPRVVIQRNSMTLFPGECWCFKGSHGYIAVSLSHYIDVSSISYEHIGKEVVPGGDRSSAPKTILIWAYKHIDDLASRALIGSYTYNLDSTTLQFFPAQNTPPFPVKFIELEVTSNYGAEFTCLYRLRVHGNRANL